MDQYHATLSALVEFQFFKKKTLTLDLWNDWLHTFEQQASKNMRAVHADNLKGHKINPVKQQMEVNKETR